MQSDCRLRDSCKALEGILSLRLSLRWKWRHHIVVRHLCQPLSHPPEPVPRAVHVATPVVVFLHLVSREPELVSNGQNGLVNDMEDVGLGLAGLGADRQTLSALKGKQEGIDSRCAGSLLWRLLLFFGSSFCPLRLWALTLAYVPFVFVVLFLCRALPSSDHLCRDGRGRRRERPGRANPGVEQYMSIRALCQHGSWERGWRSDLRHHALRDKAEVLCRRTSIGRFVPIARLLLGPLCLFFGLADIAVLALFAWDRLGSLDNLGDFDV